MALWRNLNLADFSNQEVRNVLTQTGRIAKIYGQNYIAQAQELGEFEYVVAA